MNWIFHFTCNAGTSIHWCANFAVAHFSSSSSSSVSSFLCLMPLVFFYRFYHYFKTEAVYFLQLMITVMHVELLTVGRHKKQSIATKSFSLIFFCSFMRWMHECWIYAHWRQHEKMMNFSHEIVCVCVCWYLNNTWYLGELHLHCHLHVDAMFRPAAPKSSCIFMCLCECECDVLVFMACTYNIILQAHFYGPRKANASFSAV